MMTIALYMRLSNDDGHAGESFSIKNQRDLLYAFVRDQAEFRDCTVLEFCDDGYSGTSFNRPGVQKLLSLAGNTVKCIIVKDFSRFGRNLIEVGNYLDQIFPFLGVRFIAINEGYDSGKGIGSSVSLDVSLKALIYEMYSRDISEKIRCVQQAKMKKGEYFCAVAFYGYKRSKTVKNKLEIDEAAAAVVRRIYQMAADGAVPSKIAEKLNQDGVPSPLMYRRENHTDGMRGWNQAGNTAYWTIHNVRNILLDKRYTGCLVAHKRTTDWSTKKMKSLPEEEWIVVNNTHEAIIPKESFEQVQAVLRRNRPKKGKNKPGNKFQRMLKCAYCGRTLTRIAAKNSYYSCPTARTVNDVKCARIYLDEQTLEDTLWRSIQMQIGLVQECGNELAENKESRLREEMKNCQAAIRHGKMLQMAAFEDYAQGCMDKQEYLLQKKQAAEGQEEANRRFAELTGQLAQGAELCPTKHIFVKELTRELLVELVKEVCVSEGDVLEIRWRFREVKV